MRLFSSLRIAVTGATGATGGMFLQLLAERGFPVEQITAYASPKSDGMILPYRDTVLQVHSLNKLRGEFDVLMGFCSSGVTREHRENWRKYTRFVVDNSSAYRMERGTPLIVPQVNRDAIHTAERAWYANPNCSIIQIVRAVNPLRTLGVHEMTCATYQAVSGAGRGGIVEYHRQRQGFDEVSKFRERIDGNVVAWIGDAESSGYTSEESKLRDEARKIFDMQQLQVNMTCVRVPVENAHSAAVFLAVQQPTTRADVLELLRSDSSLIVRDELQDDRLPSPLEVSGTDSVLVGRVRVDPENASRISLWVVADNLRVGAATNALSIVDHLLESGKFE